MRGYAGFDFKDGGLNSAQRELLDIFLSRFEDIDSASEYRDKDRIFLFKPTNGRLHIFGVNGNGVNAMAGIVWGSVQDDLLQTLYYANIAKFFPYNVFENTIYSIKDGEAYIYLQRGDKINTAHGGGVVYSIDDINNICVELDNDKSVFFEFSINEIMRG